MSATAATLEPKLAMMATWSVCSEERPPARRRWGAVAALVALAAYLLAGASLGPLSLRHAPTPARHMAAPQPQAGVDGSAGIDVDRIVSSVQHRVAPAPGRPGELAASDTAYRARFHHSGFELRPTGTTGSLGVRLRGVEPGGHARTADVGAWRGEANRAVRGIGPGSEEVVTVREREAEWDVVLSRAPAGRGDLVVSADLTGAVGVVPEEGALRLTLTGGGHLRMGDLVVKDATGSVVYRALPRTQGQRLILQVPDEVLVGARYPLTLDPTVSAERVMTTATHNQFTSDVAFDGTNYLVVWTDYRNGTPDIYGARVQPDGVVLDTAGIPITTAPDDQGYPAVTYYGPNYLVVWESRLSDSTYDIYGARVGTNGAVIDTTAAPFSTKLGSTQSMPAIAFNGQTVLVVWQDRYFGTDDIFGTRWSPSLGVLDPGDGIKISTQGNGKYNPAVTAYGTDFLVVWETFHTGTAYDISGVRVGANGTVIDGFPANFTSSTGQENQPALAFDGTNVLIVWEDSRPGTNLDIYGARWSPSTGLLDPSGIPIATQSGNQRGADVASNGGFLVVWTDERSGEADVYGSRVAGDGTVTDPGGIPISTVAGGESRPAVTKGKGTAWGTSYERPVGTNNDDIFFRSVSPK